MSEKSVAIVLSAGRGKRMNSQVSKQYLLIKNKPVICYSLEVFQNCPFIDEIILVAGEEDLEFCRREIVEKYGFTKVTSVTAGGAERYHSVYKGLCQIEDCDFVYIHDGARPFVSEEILGRAAEDARKYHACVVGMPVKDTIKIGDKDGFSQITPERDRVWQIQTPQVFRFSLVKDAYGKLMKELEAGRGLAVTDDAMVIETMTETKVKLTRGSYRNIKITTPEDLKLAEIFVS